MGMGKTIQAISLIMSHRSDEEQRDRGNSLKQNLKDKINIPEEQKELGLCERRKKLKLPGVKIKINKSSNVENILGIDRVSSKTPLLNRNSIDQNENIKKGCERKNKVNIDHKASNNTDGEALNESYPNVTSLPNESCLVTGKIDHSTGLGMEIKAVDDEIWEADLAHAHLKSENIGKQDELGKNADGSSSCRKKVGTAVKSHHIDQEMRQANIQNKSSKFAFKSSQISEIGESGSSGMRSNKWSGATLVLCPMVALVQWRQEIARFTEPGALRVAVYHGAKRNEDPKLLETADVVLSTYNTIEADFRKGIMPSKISCDYCGKVRRHAELLASCI